MLLIQEHYLQEIKETVGCDMSSFYFFNEQSRELMTCINERWFRVPSDSGIPGFCAQTGDTVSIADAYQDHRFNE